MLLFCLLCLMAYKCSCLLQLKRKRKGARERKSFDIYPMQVVQCSSQYVAAMLKPSATAQLSLSWYFPAFWKELWIKCKATLLKNLPVVFRIIFLTHLVNHLHLQSSWEAT